MPKDIKSTNSAETEKVTNEEAEKRRADQDAAVEEAFLEGTLPEEDRRTGAPNVAPLVGDPNPSTVRTSDAIPAGRRAFIGPDATLHRADGSTMREEHGHGKLLNTLPPNSRAIWSNIDVPAGQWRVELGPGNNKSIGVGETLRRALRMVGAKMGRHPDDQLRQVLLDEHERPIHPNLDTDPDDPRDPNQQPKTVDGEGNVIAVSAADSTVGEATVEPDEEADDEQDDTEKSKSAKKRGGKK